MIRPRPRATVLGGIAIGLTAGVAVYGAISPSSVATSPKALTAFTMPRPPITVTRVTPPLANLAPCAADSQLEKDVCIVQVVRTVVVPAPVAASNPSSGQAAPANSAPASSVPTGNSPGSPASVSPGDGATAGTRAMFSTRTPSGTRAMSSTRAVSSTRAMSSTRGAAPTGQSTESAKHAAEQATESSAHATEQATESAKQAAEQAAESASHTAE